MKLTERVFAPGVINPTDLIHIVITGDTNQSPQGSSYKVELGKVIEDLVPKSFTGGTVSGATNFTGGLTSTTISATTYQNLPLTPFLPLSGGTVTGRTTFTSGLTANTITTTTISATTYNNYIPLPTTAGSSTGTTITFITDRVYGTTTLPISGSTISGDTNGGQIGVTNIIVHNNTTIPPSFSINMKKLSGSSSYVINEINYIYCTYIDSNTIIYSINQIT